MLRYALNIAFLCAVIKAVQDFLLKKSIGELSVTFITFFLIGLAFAVPLYWFRKAKTQEESGWELEKIILTVMGMGIVFGMLHDQVNARLSPEYYTVAHFDLGIYDPTLLGIVWGFLGTWWIAAILGVFISLACRYGSLPKLNFRHIVKPLLGLFAIMEIIALSVGYVVFQKAKAGELTLPYYADLVPAEQHAGFLADWWMNGTLYALGPLLAIGFCWFVYQQRKKLP